ncbi:MAG: RNA polymerase sigma factor [Planctomycetota bacterium]
MGDREATCWTVIEGAAAGRAEDREDFARRYLPVVRSYLLARWRQSPLRVDLEDAIQEVFLDCFKRGGALEKAERDRGGGFQAFLYGVVRNVARHFETSRARRKVRGSVGFDPDRERADEESLSKVFDRAWATEIMREAANLQASAAESDDEGRGRRVELLRLRFHSDLPIREIAKRWEEDPAVLHREYTKARREFRAALREAVAFHYQGPDEEIERRCGELLQHL